MGLPVVLTERLRAAVRDVAAVDPDAHARLSALFARAHDEAVEVLQGAREHSPLSSIAGAWAALHDGVATLETHLATAGGVVEGHLPEHVSPDGELWGVGTYLQLDPGWVEALAHYLENRHHKAPFRTSPRVIDLADAVRIGVVGDWGTGFWRPHTGAERVRDRMAIDRADINIHLGDTYYAGSAVEERDKLVALWPAGTVASFTLDSNHEMYDGARAYFDVALAAPAFAAQGGTSYFALRNAHWLVLGLDTGYHATGEMFFDGALGADQAAFVAHIAAGAGNRRIVVLSHHEGTDLRGTRPNGLWQEVVQSLGRPPDAWYWGHAHNGIVYAPLDGCRIRCVGHGAIPYGTTRMLAGQASVLWSETMSAHDAETPARVTNGYLRLALDGPALTETLVAEDGAVRWQGRW